MGLAIDKLARFVAETKWDDIPAPVQRHAKLVFLDTFGVILAGSVRPEVRRLRERLAPTAGSGATLFARGWPVHEPRTAALLNGIAGRAIELCEGLRLITGQPAMQTLPGTLAVGEQVEVRGRLSSRSPGSKRRRTPSRRRSPTSWETASSPRRCSMAWARAGRSRAIISGSMRAAIPCIPRSIACRRC